jgi:hypothetical protein
MKKGLFVCLMSFQLFTADACENALLEEMLPSEHVSAEMLAKLLLELTAETDSGCQLQIVESVSNHPELISTTLKFNEGLGHIIEAMLNAGHSKFLDNLLTNEEPKITIDQIGTVLMTQTEKIDHHLYKDLLIEYLSDQPTYCDVVLSNLKQSNKAQVLDEIMTSRKAQNLPICGSIDYEAINK